MSREEVKILFIPREETREWVGSVSTLTAEQENKEPCSV